MGCLTVGALLPHEPSSVSDKGHGADKTQELYYLPDCFCKRGRFPSTSAKAGES
ncbi:uncharacterized protein RSE6_07402 [Rhynchosporium secalis]|uniref:Uncharacterized protein n=1 Tax=Rhynchosporium secalis TaxID=38038 RepID=A0A1E1MDV7_RHYSE|nr:uncharacterized protein RSE6_07402 [Rhynchosporium secalis]